MKDKNLMKRVIAYFIDYTVVMLLVMLITSTKYLNPTYDTALEKSEALSSLNTSYVLSTTTFLYYYRDSEISDSEYNDLIKDNDYFGYLIVDAYSDKVITTEEYNKIKDTAKEVYQNKSEDIYYEAIKANWYTYLIYTIVYFGYFVIFNMITKGISLGKRITGLKIASVNGKFVSFGAYLGRSLLAYGYFIYPLEILLPFIVPKVYLASVSSFISLGVNLLQMVVIVSILYNANGRGLHDYAVGTWVVGINDDAMDAVVLETKEVQEQDEALDNSFEEKTVDEVKSLGIENIEKKAEEKTINRETFEENKEVISSDNSLSNEKPIEKKNKMKGKIK